jgi:sporulation integral membrane protein YlbJ
MHKSFSKKTPAGYILTFLLLYIIFLLVLNPDKYIQSVYNGLILFAVNVLPALFPFFFLTKLLTYAGNVEWLTNIMRKPVKKLFKMPPQFSYIFFISILSGYPVGAKLVSETTQGDKNSLTRLAAVCSTSGPVFITGTVGFSMLRDKNAGFILYAAHIISVLIFALFSGLFIKNTNAAVYQKNTELSGNALSESVYGSVISILIVGGFVSLFYMFIDMLLNTAGGIVNLTYITGSFIPFDTVKGLITGIIEVTRGCRDISTVGAPLNIKMCLCCFLITFGGFCVMLQGFTFLGNSISRRKFILYKFIQGLIALLICFILCLIFKI